ncbi:hypothetical protein SAMN04488057_102128 [Cyclobacterium lianum]|uniref:Uncharacterized protein n=1 Tax=Cyclobacterium lianum TaxID=388280 RepID=A0A1M7JSD9_9BACT|nr:hypothetical protein SAMN04488057_102128 [Cyclobacterium lianum]
MWPFRKDQSSRNVMADVLVKFGTFGKEMAKKKYHLFLLQITFMVCNNRMPAHIL